ncbi:lipase 3-like [Bicyclus anynana]|uniref:Lipase 3-like n=1 Tax=Bicyclus anynana TaxID=110368 RepID=A0A6J1MVQ8_BICAN|nr:lipase 3-like [Bicyclus anynana]
MCADVRQVTVSALHTMRAVYLLLCVALAHHAAASIFRHQLRPRTDSLVIQPLDYVDQHHAKEMKIRLRRPDSSEESKERIYDDLSDYATLRSGRNWNSPLFSVLAQGEAIPYGDVIEWHGVEIATGPKSPVNNKKDIERIFNHAYKVMKHMTEEDKKKIHEAFATTALAANEDVHLNATQLIKKHGYGVEEHVVKTDDGYLLTLFRIQPRQALVEDQRPVVFLMHGFLGSADEWLLSGPEKSLAYLLTEAGYDVWLGNVRGTKYSRRHVSKHASHPDFWHFSIDEIALHDLPAMIDHTLKTSGQKKLHYVGYSQGSTVFFAWAATVPETGDKILSMHALAPMVYMTNVRSPPMRMIAPGSHFYERIIEELGDGEYKPSKELVHTIGGSMCEKVIGCEHICSNENFVTAGPDTAGMDADVIPVIVSHLPAGASARQVKQFGQGVSSQEFRKYDYGVDINKMVYGHPQPPAYNMTEVKVPVTLYYSEEDWLVHPKDVERLQKELPDVRGTYKVSEKHFSHMDFQFSNKAPEVVYKKLVESLQTTKPLSL